MQLNLVLIISQLMSLTFIWNKTSYKR